MRIFTTTIVALTLSVSLFAQGPDLSKLRPTEDMIPVARFQNAELQDVLHLIADSHGLRIEFAPGVDVHHQIPVFTLQNVKVADAIQLILDAVNVNAVVVDETTLRILPKP